LPIAFVRLILIILHRGVRYEERGQAVMRKVEANTHCEIGLPAKLGWIAGKIEARLEPKTA
jgi:hypothetical protein